MRETLGERSLQYRDHGRRGAGERHGLPGAVEYAGPEGVQGDDRGDLRDVPAGRLGHEPYPGLVDGGLEPADPERDGGSDRRPRADRGDPRPCRITGIRP